MTQPFGQVMTSLLSQGFLFQGFYNLQYGSQMFPISLSSSSVHSLISDFFCSISFCFFFIISIVFHSLALSPFYLLQFLSNLIQYFSSYFLSNYPNNFLAINLPGNSLLLKIPFSFSCLLTSSMSYWYSFSNFSTTSFVLSRFSFPSQVLDLAVNPFYHTKYLFSPFIHHLFKILLTSHSSFPLIITKAGCSFFCPSTCPMYLCILLTLTTGCIFTILDSSCHKLHLDHNSRNT